jgi:hypothetical protein
MCDGRGNSEVKQVQPVKYMIYVKIQGLTSRLVLVKSTFPALAYGHAIWRAM